MRWGCPVEKNNLFPGGGTVELSLVRREGVSPENRGSMFQAEEGGKEPWVPVAARSLWLIWSAAVGPEAGKGGGRAGSHIWMFCSWCRSIPEVCQQGQSQLSLRKGVNIGCWQACKVHFNRMGVLAVFLLIRRARDWQSSLPWTLIVGFQSSSRQAAHTAVSAQQGDSAAAPTAAVWKVCLNRGHWHPCASEP